MDRQAHWQGVYESKAESEVSWFQERPASSLALIADTGLAQNARMVDIGGGASRLVDHLLDQGWQSITVLDLAAAALDRARSRLGQRARQVDWVVGDVTRWQPSASFDLWHDRAVFHFLTDRSDRMAYAETMANALRRDGHAIIGTFAPDGPERCSGLPIVRYDAEGLTQEFAGSLELIATTTEDHLTPAGKVQKFQFCRFRKR